MKRPLSLAGRRVAALFIDLQEEHRQDERYRVEGYDVVLSNARALQTAARRSGVPVLHAAYLVDASAGPPRPLHPMTPDGRSAFSNRDDPRAAICPEVAPRADEPVIEKAEASAFAGGRLAGLLAASACEWLVVAGVWTEACVDATVKAAIDRGVRVLLVKDACGSGTAAMHQAGILNLANRLYGGAVVDTAAACRLLEGETLEAWQVQGSVPIRYDFASAAALYAAL